MHYITIILHYKIYLYIIVLCYENNMNPVLGRLKENTFILL